MDDAFELESLPKNFMINQNKIDEIEIEELIKSYLNILNGKDTKEKDELELELKDGNEMIYDVVLWKSHTNLGPAAIVNFGMKLKK
jgi:hypothetical protein